MIEDVLVSIPGVVLGGFSLYFAYQKIGSKVLASYSVVSNLVSESRISDITLINKKNKPITIFSIQAVINEDIVVEVENFQPAMVLKSLESTYVITTPFSHLHIGQDKYKADYFRPNKVDLYLITEKSKIRCQVISHPEISKYFDFKRYRKTVKYTMCSGQVFLATVF